MGVNETSKFWLGMLNELKIRGIKDIFFCVDRLPGFKEAIWAVYLQTEFPKFRHKIFMPSINYDLNMYLFRSLILWIHKENVLLAVIDYIHS